MSATRPQLPQEFIAAHKRRRMIDAMAELCAEQGYEATKIADVVRHAHVARKTLYDNFSGKEELFLAAFDLTVTEAEAEVAEACDPIDAGGLGGAHRSRPAGAARVRRRPPGGGEALPGRGARRRPGPPPATRRRSKASSAACGRPRRRGRHGPPRWRRRWSAAWSGSSSGRSAADGADRCSRPAPELTEFVISPYRSVGKR